MKLQQLRAFVKVLESGSFSEAALELGISQSTLSYTIGELERELGVKLFERGRFGAVATDAGRAIESHVRTMLRFENAIFQEASLAKASIEGYLRVATFRSVASQILPSIMAAFKRQFPDLVLELIEMECGRDMLKQALDRGHCDVAVTQVSEDELDIEDNTLHWELMRESYVAILPKSEAPKLEATTTALRAAYPSAQPDEERSRYVVSWRQLTNYAPIMHGGHNCGELIHEQLERALVTVPAIQLVRDDFTSMQLAAQGLGVSVMPRLASYPLHDGVIRADIVEPLRRVIEVLLLPSSLKIPATRLLLNALKQRFPESSLPTFNVRQQVAVEPLVESDVVSSRRFIN
ncbi:MAG: LysR family transcriptional regulator [Deinococcota bacterium]